MASTRQRTRQRTRAANHDSDASSTGGPTQTSAHSNPNANHDQKPPTPTTPGLQTHLEGLANTSPRWKNWWVRTFWTFVMIGGFFAIIASGPIAVILMVLGIQILVFKEVISLASMPNRERKLPWARALNWYMLLATNYYLYGESVTYYFKHFVLIDRVLQPLATHHRFISLSLYLFGFVWFVGNLKKGFYKFQFTQFAWTHMTLLMVVFTSHCIINNIFEGLLWFFLPISFVITNDIFAYVFGFFFGRTPLIHLSPKKTWEGFVGGWLMTMVFGFFAASFLARYPYMHCPVKDLSMNTFSETHCDLNPVFVPETYEFPVWLSGFFQHALRLPITSMAIAPFQWHVLVLACFASLIAPFGGFFASGLKRAFKIKDFGQSIPGHGGITDRMDCQFMMGVFSYIYCKSFINVSHPDVAALFEAAVTSLSVDEQLQLYRDLGQYLTMQSILPVPTLLSP